MPWPGFQRNFHPLQAYKSFIAHAKRKLRLISFILHSKGRLLPNGILSRAQRLFFSIYLQYLEAKASSASAVPMEGVFINMFTWAWKQGRQAPAFSGLLHPGAGDQITTRQEKIKQRCRASARSLARPRDPGGWPADRRGGWRWGGAFPSRSMGPSQGPADALFPVAGGAGRPWGRAEGPGSAHRTSPGSSHPSSDTGGLEPDAGNTVLSAETNQDLLPRSPCLNSETVYSSSVPLFLGNPLEKQDCRGAVQQGMWTREGCSWLPPVYIGRAVLYGTTS